MTLVIPRFPLGTLAITPDAEAALAPHPGTLACILTRHAHCDWGDLCSEDADANNDAMVYGDRLLSSYAVPGDVTVWVITEADRATTTVLLPSDY